MFCDCAAAFVGRTSSAGGFRPVRAGDGLERTGRKLIVMPCPSPASSA